ncbi:MAG: glycosyltransferase, partial [Solirubrobacterales bacterium]|nr:glycosyltransferase [Solirubrobacterales bacterium]
GRWDRGVDLTRFSPSLRDPGLLPGQIKIFYAGRLTKEKGVDLLADAFLTARERDPRLHLLLAGGGPEEDQLRARLGDTATFLGWLHGADLARAYASADLFLFASRTDTFGQVVVEAQASGLPVVAVAEGGPLCLIEDGETGRLTAPQPRALANALLDLLGDDLQRERIRRAALAAVQGRTWEGSMEQLAAGYRATLATPSDDPQRQVA